MLSTIVFAASLALATRAAVVPTEPAPGRDFRVGGDCSVSWVPDTTGQWTHTSIQLMTGSNEAMVHLTTVLTFDGTDTTRTSYTFDCPDVSPHSAIYFYQFTSDATLADPMAVQWTGRWSISNGSDITPGANPLPDGSAWGVGHLVGTTGTPAPPTSPQFAGNAPSGSASVTKPGSATGSPTGRPSASTPAPSGSRTPTPSGSRTTTGTASSTPSTTPPPGAAVALRGSALGALVAGAIAFALL